MREADAQTLRDGILGKYRRVAVSPAGSFRYPVGEASAVQLGYSPELLAAVPTAVRERFVGVGNPFALRPIAVGERVLDLGCGAGLDVLIAAQLVGPTGRVAGVDLGVHAGDILYRPKAASRGAVTPIRLLKKAHLRGPILRTGTPRARAALRRTRKYASHLASRAALHLDLFEQPGRKVVFQ
jgi:SAM-dependent methyltransferase